MSSIADDLSTITLPELRAIAVAHYSGHGGSRMTRPRVVEFLLRKLADEEHLLCTTSRRRGNPSSPPIEDLSTRAHQQMRTRYGPKLFDQYLRSSVRATDVRLVQPTSPAVDNESASDDLQNPVLETYEHPIETASWPEPISQELKDECSQAFRKGTAIALAATCAVCARRTFTEDVFYTKTHLQCKRVPISQLSLDILRITDPFILGHPGDHFTFGADELDGLALDANGVHITETSTELDVCDECRQYLNKAKLPPAALANGNIRGHLPESLRDCTWLEERLCAKYLASAYIVRLYDFTAPGAPAERPRVMKGHSCAFPLNTVATAARLPWSFDDGGPLLSCIVIGPRKPRLSDLRQVFKVRRQKVQDLLEYLKHNFKDYPQFDIDAAVLQSLPIDDVPELLMRSVVHQETGDVPSLFDFETAGIEPHAGLTADDDIAADLGRTFLEHHGMLDVNGVSIPSHARTASALSNATGTERPDLIIKHGSSFIQDYNNPQLFPGMFPLLFPWGIGGFESERDAPFSFNKQATYLLDLADPAFRRHWSFVFVVANIKQRRAIHNGSRLACKSRDYTAFSRTLAELDSDVVKRIAEHAASGGSLDTLCGEERKIFRLLSKCQVVSKKVPGSKAIMDLARADIRGYIGEHGIFQLFLTLNPHPAYGPPFQIFYGNNNINLDLRMPDMPPRATTAVQVADDPVAAADYFHFHVGAVFQYLFGWDVRKKASTSSGGILGRMAAFFLVKEHTMRGQLHGHALIWLEGALNPGPLRQKLRVDEAFQKKYLAFMDNLIVHEVPAPPTPLPISAIEHHFAPSAPDVRRPRTEMPPSPEQGDYRREFQSDQHLLGEELQRHTCRATCFKGGRNSCRFLFPHTINETPHFDPDDNSVNLRIRDANVNWYNPTLLVATRHNHDLKAIQSGKSSAAAAAYVTTYATKSDETPVNQIAMINTVFQRLDQCGDLHTETKTLLSKCVMQFGRERQLHAQQVATYVRDLGDTFQSHKTVPMLSGSMLAHVFQLWGPPRVKEADVVVFTETSDAIALGEVGEEDDEQDSFTHAEYGDSLLSLSAAGLAHQVTDYMHRGPTLQDVTFYDFVQRAKLFPAPKELYKTHHPLSQSHPNVDSHCHRYNPATSHGIPRAVFRRWPRPDGTPLHGDLYCAAMLLHFRAFSVTNPLKSSETTYEAVFHQTPFPQHALKIMANWNALTECDDARDEQQLLRRKREALRGAGQDDVVAIDTREGMDDQNADVNTAALKAQGRNESRETSAFSAALSGGSWFDTTNTSTIQDCLPATYQCPPFTPSRRRQWKKQQDEVEATTKADRSVAKATSGVLAQDLGFDKHFQAGKVLTCSTFDFDDVQNPNLPADTLRLRWETTQPHILIQDLIKERGLNASQALTFKIVARHFFQELYEPAKIVDARRGRNWENGGGASIAGTIGSIRES
ncbi:hypothetical protein CF326_g3896 [Tilletia indica]|nr:hypothetical protein CF326_g3896 [Tilletia indica]